MEKTIVVFGLTEGQAELLAAALPDAYTIQSAETITDLLVADAVCGIIHAEVLDERSVSILRNYYADSEDYASEQIIWIGETAPCKAFPCYGSFGEMFEELGSILQAAQHRYDIHAMYCGNYALLPAKCIADSLEADVDKMIYEKYGKNPDQVIIKRMRQEWTALLEIDAVPELAAVYELTMWLKTHAHPYWIGGNAPSGFVPYLLGITRVNPLPTELGGQNLVWQEFCSYGRAPLYEIHFSEGLKPRIIEWLKDHWLSKVNHFDWKALQPYEPNYTANADKTLAVWLKPQIFQMNDSSDVVNILFLDEISAAPQSVQAAAYQITLDRVVGEHRLPDNCIVIAAGNRTTDKSVAFKMPKALANRLLHIEVEGSFKAWKEWAIRSGINPKVVGFLSFRQQYLMKFDASSEDLAFATPRSWEMVSNLMNHVSDDVDEMYHLISGLVGMGIAIEFRTWSKVYNDLPDLEDIFDGKMPQMPSGTDAMYALAAAMTAYARDHRTQLNRIANSIRFADRMPPDFSAMLLKDYLYIEEGYREKLLSIPEFSRWLSSKGRLINGTV